MSLPNTNVGAFDARTRFFELLERIEAGEEVTIMRHGVAVARLVPAECHWRVASVKRVHSLRHAQAAGEPILQAACTPNGNHAVKALLTGATPVAPSGWSELALS